MCKFANCKNIKKYDTISVHQNKALVYVKPFVVSIVFVQTHQNFHGCSAEKFNLMKKWKKEVFAYDCEIIFVILEIFISKKQFM